MDFDCPARTVKEEVLQGAILTAVNDAYARKNIVTALLRQNIETTVFEELEARIAAVDEKLADLQTQMIEVSGDEMTIEALGEQIDTLREERRPSLPRRQNAATLRNA